MRFVKALCPAAVVLLTAGAASAATTPFTESFDTNDSGWQDALNAAPTYVATGGALDNGGYISVSFDPTASSVGSSDTVFRATGSAGASGGGFTGDYVTGGITEYTFYARHNAPVPVSFFTRFAPPANFPGAIGVGFAPVLPNTCTPVTIAIDASNPQFISFGGSNLNAIFSNIGNLQVGLTVPAGATSAFTVDLDEVSIVPEPGSAALLGLGGLMLLGRRRRAVRAGRA